LLHYYFIYIGDGTFNIMKHLKPTFTEIDISLDMYIDNDYKQVFFSYATILNVNNTAIQTWKYEWFRKLLIHENLMIQYSSYDKIIYAMDYNINQRKALTNVLHAILGNKINLNELFHYCVKVYIKCKGFSGLIRRNNKNFIKEIKYYLDLIASLIFMPPSLCVIMFEYIVSELRIKLYKFLNQHSNYKQIIKENNFKTHLSAYLKSINNGWFGINITKFLQYRKHDIYTFELQFYYQYCKKTGETEYRIEYYNDLRKCTTNVYEWCINLFDLNQLITSNSNESFNHSINQHFSIYNIGDLFKFIGELEFSAMRDWNHIFNTKHGYKSMTKRKNHIKQKYIKLYQYQKMLYTQQSLFFQNINNLLIMFNIFDRQYLLNQKTQWEKQNAHNNQIKKPIFAINIFQWKQFKLNKHQLQIINNLKNSYIKTIFNLLCHINYHIQQSRIYKHNKLYQYTIYHNCSNFFNPTKASLLKPDARIAVFCPINSEYFFGVIKSIYTQKSNIINNKKIFIEYDTDISKYTTLLKDPIIINEKNISHIFILIPYLPINKHHFVEPPLISELGNYMAKYIFNNHLYSNESIKNYYLLIHIDKEEFNKTYYCNIQYKSFINSRWRKEWKSFLKLKIEIIYHNKSRGVYKCVIDDLNNSIYSGIIVSKKNCYFNSKDIQYPPLPTKEIFKKFNPYIFHNGIKQRYHSINHYKAVNKIIYLKIKEFAPNIVRLGMFDIRYLLLSHGYKDSYYRLTDMHK